MGCLTTLLDELDECLFPYNRYAQDEEQDFTETQEDPSARIKLYEKHVGAIDCDDDIDCVGADL